MQTSQSHHPRNATRTDSRHLPADRLSCQRRASDATGKGMDAEAYEVTTGRATIASKFSLAAPLPWYSPCRATAATYLVTITERLRVGGRARHVATIAAQHRQHRLASPHPTGSDAAVSRTSLPQARAVLAAGAQAGRDIVRTGIGLDASHQPTADCHSGNHPVIMAVDPL